MGTYINAVQTSVFVTLYFGVVFFVTPAWAPKLLWAEDGGDGKPQDVPGFRGTDLSALLPLLVAAHTWHIPVYVGLSPIGALLAVVGVSVFVVWIWTSALRFMKKRGITRGRFLFQLLTYPLAVLGSAGVVVNILILVGVLLQPERQGTDVVAVNLATASMVLLCIGACVLSRHLLRLSLNARRDAAT